MTLPSSTSSPSSPASRSAASTQTTTLTGQPTLPSLPSVRRVTAKIMPQAKLLLVGEAPGAEEEKLLTPFVGAAGKELDHMMADAEILRSSISMTNVFDVRPPQNNLLHWCADKKEAGVGINPALPWAWIQPETAKYITAAHVQPALVRLREEIKRAAPNCIVALGNIALAALCGVSGIGRLRGTLHECTLVPGIKVIPTYHPAAILRQYDNRGFVVADLMKAKAESAFPDFRFLRRALHIEPTVSDLYTWRDRLVSASEITMDVETKPSIGQITCIGFSPSPTEAYVIPFWDRRKPDGHYWSFEDEKIAWRIVASILSAPNIKIMQNGIYDVQYCLMYKWNVKGFVHDTMILHHSLYPSVPKGLDFLGSLYVNERAWKKFRPRGGEEKSDA